MELRRFRSDDHNTTSSGFPVSSSSNFFTEQAFHGGYGMNGPRISSELMRNSSSMELFQREVEKRRIREEIIATEIIRRQTLEAEVRRELARERGGLGFQQEEGLPLLTSSSSCLSTWSDQKRSSSMQHINHRRPDDSSSAFEERVSFLSGQQVGRIENSPFQRHPDAAKVAEVNRGPVLFIPKPTPSVAGMKRKLDSTLGTGFLANAKKKIQKDWACDLCHVKVTCEQGLSDHIKGKKHRMKEEAALKANAAVGSSVTSEEKSDNPEAEAKEEIICSPKPNEEEKKAPQVKRNGEASSCQDMQKTDMVSKKFKYWCDCCQIGCHSLAVLADHEGGKKHQTRLRLRNSEQAAIVSTTSVNANDEKTIKDSSGKEGIMEDGEPVQEEEGQWKNANDEKTIEYSAGEEDLKEESVDVTGRIDAEEDQEEEDKQCKNANNEKTTEYPAAGKEAIKEASGDITENANQGN